MDAKKIGDVCKEVDGVVVLKVTGEIVFVGKGKMAPGFNGGAEEHKQGVAIKDETGNIWVNIKNHSEIPIGDKGKILTIEAFESDTHGWIGCKKGSYDKADDKGVMVKQHTLEVTKTGKITVSKPGEKPAEKEAPPAQPSPAAKEPAKAEAKPTPSDSKTPAPAPTVLGQTAVDDFRGKCIIEVVKCILSQGKDTRLVYNLCDVAFMVDSMVWIYLKDKSKSDEILKSVGNGIAFGDGK